MTKSLDQLISYLIDEIGAAGPAGVSIPQLLGLVKTFYDGDQCVDNSLLAQVWKWLGRHPDISLGAARKFNQTPLQEFQVDPTDPLTPWKSRSPKVHASEDLIYKSICGHSRQEAQLFPLEHALLMQIAAARGNGIMQGDLGRQTGQDKRSVPKRTDFLQAKGYIFKQPVINKGTKTSLLILRRYAHYVAAPTSTTPPFLVRDVLQQLRHRLSDGSPVELAKLTDMMGDEGEAAKKVLSRIIRALEKAGCYKRVKTAFGPSAHSSDLKTVIQQVRAPSDEDLLSFEQGPLALHRPVIDLVNEEKSKKNDQAPRALPLWNPDRLMVNQIQDMVQSMTPGFEAGARKALFGPFLQTAISPAAASPPPLSQPSRAQPIKPFSPPDTSDLLSKQIQDVNATNLIPRSEEPHILRGADGLEVVQPIAAAAKSPDPNPAETPKRRPKREKSEKKVRPRIVKTDEEMRPQGRPRRFLRGTEKFWQHHFWQAKLAEVGDHNVPVKKVGIMHDPAGMRLFESRPHDFDETLVQAIAAGLPIPATPDAINSDWVRDTRAVLGRSANGAYVTPAGMYLGRARHRSQLLIIRTSRRNLLDWHHSVQTPAFRFITSMAAHSSSYIGFNPTMEQRESSILPSPKNLRQRKKRKTDQPKREISPDTAARRGPKPHVFLEPVAAVTTISPYLPAKESDHDLYMGTTESDTEPERRPRQAGRNQPSKQVSRAQKSNKLALSPSNSLPGSELEGGPTLTPNPNKARQQTPSAKQDAGSDQLAKSLIHEDQSHSTDYPTLSRPDGVLLTPSIDEERDGRIPIAAQDDIPGNRSSPGPVKAPDVCDSQTADEAIVERERLDGTSAEEPGKTTESHNDTPGQSVIGEQCDAIESEQILQTRQGRGGDVSICQEILLELIQLAQGAAPYNRQTLQRCMAARWQANGGTGYRPLMKVIKSAVARLVESEKVREHTFSFRGKGGAMIKRSILHFPSVHATSAQISELKERIMVADTTEYIPQEWATVMLPPGQLVERKSRARKSSVSEQSADANPDKCSDEERGSARSRRAPKRRKTRHESPSGPREETPVSESMPTSSLAQAFLTLKVPNIGTLPQVQDHNLRVRERERLNSARYAWGDDYGAGSRDRSVHTGSGSNMIWAPHDMLPASLDDLVRVENGNQPNDESAASFFKQVDLVAKWERREAQSILGHHVPWRFFNHLCSIRAPSPSGAARWFLVNFNSDLQPVESEWADFPGWSGLKDALQPRVSPDKGITSKAAAQGRRLTRQATGAIKKTKWTGLDDPVELENGSAQLRGKKRRRRTATATTINQNLSGDSEWEGEDGPIHTDRRPKKRIRTVARSRPSPRLEGKDLAFAIGVLCVRSLVGGIEQNVDWRLVQSISPDLDEAAARERWKSLLSKHREEIDNLVQQFQDKYVTAFDQGQAPAVDFENLGQTDWHGIVTWAEANLTTPRSQAIPEPPLAASKKELLAEHALELQQARDLDSVYEHGMTMNNSAKEQLYSAVISGTPASGMWTPRPHHDHRLEAARSYVLSTVLTPELSFDAKRAEEKLLSLESVGTESKTALSRAVNALHREKIISKHASDTLGPLGLRQWKVSNAFGDVMESRRLVNRSLLRTAAHYKTQVLDSSFGAGERVSVAKEAIVDDGILLAILNLISQGQIAIRPGSDAPCSRYGIDWENAGYQTRLIDRGKAIFTTMLSPTETYTYGDPVQSSRLEHVPRGDMDQPGGPVPLWVDIHGNVLAEWWETAVAAVLGLLNVRPGLSAEACARMLNWTLTSHDVDLILRWGKDSGVTMQGPGGKGWEATAWWWLALGHNVDWT